MGYKPTEKKGLEWIPDSCL